MNKPAGFKKVIEHFRSHQWSCREDPDAPILRAGFRGDNAEFGAAVAVDESDTVVEVVGTVPIMAPPRKRAKVAELCAYLSWGMRMGRFEMDPADGEIRFHASSAYPSGELDDSVIRMVVGVALAMLDEHFPAFVRVIYGNVPPAEAALQIRERVCHRQKTAPGPVLHLPARLSLN